MAAAIRQLLLGGSGGMSPTENFEILGALGCPQATPMLHTCNNVVVAYNRDIIIILLY